MKSILKASARVAMNRFVALSGTAFADDTTPPPDHSRAGEPLPPPTARTRRTRRPARRSGATAQRARRSRPRPRHRDHRQDALKRLAQRGDQEAEAQKHKKDTTQTRLRPTPLLPAAWTTNSLTSFEPASHRGRPVFFCLWNDFTAGAQSPNSFGPAGTGMLSRRVAAGASSSSLRSSAANRPARSGGETPSASTNCCRHAGNFQQRVVIASRRDRQYPCEERRGPETLRVPRPHLAKHHAASCSPKTSIIRSRWRFITRIRSANAGSGGSTARLDELQRVAENPRIVKRAATDRQPAQPVASSMTFALRARDVPVARRRDGPHCLDQRRMPAKFTEPSKPCWRVRPCTMIAATPASSSAGQVRCGQFSSSQPRRILQVIGWRTARSSAHQRRGAVELRHHGGAAAHAADLPHGTAMFTSTEATPSPPACAWPRPSRTARSENLHGEGNPPHTFRSA